MGTEERKGLQIKPNQDITGVAIVGGGIKIAASGKAISTSFAVAWGRIYVTIDCSGSMKGSKIEQAKTGTLNFAREAFLKNYYVGCIKFAGKAEHLVEPTTDLAVLQNKLSSLRANGATNMPAAIKMARTKLVDFSGSKVMVIATDGMPDNVNKTLQEADEAKAAGIEILTIGTDDADTEFLKKLASKAELSKKVTSEKFAEAIYDASALLSGPRSIKPK